MSVKSDEIVKRLPYLRRYARALAGSQDRGDQYVRVALEAIVAEPERIQEDGDIRLQLFSIFHDVWTIFDGSGVSDGSSLGGQSLQQGLAALPPRERQVLLLVSLEGFSFDETAHILKISESEVRDCLDMARAEMRRQASAPILIIEDEPLIAMDIARLVEEMGHTVCGTAARKDEALALAADTNPALVLADIQLKGGDSGIETVQEILRMMNAPVIFVTGFPERLLTGEALEPAFVVSKPFEPEMLKAAIGQALAVHPPRPQG